MKNNRELALEILMKTDGYKLVHADQYPEGTQFIYSNLSTRKSKHKYIEDDIFVFGLNYIKQKIISEWDVFFKLTRKELEHVLTKFQIFNIEYHNLESYNIERFYELWDYGSLPLEIKTIEDRTLVPIGYPIINIYNTDEKFYWMTNYIESYLLTMVWPLVTSSTVSYNLRKIFKSYIDETSCNKGFDYYQGSDFSYRGMSGNDSGVLSGIGHLSNFEGSSTLGAVFEFNKHFGRLSKSVPATEHSVMTSYGKSNELESFERMLDIYPKGILSIVSDSWDIWNVLDNILVELKEKVESREGKLVIRPDSGDPFKIICGDCKSNYSSEKLGMLRMLDKVFGSTTNSKGFKVLNPKVGIIYGDGINFDAIYQILDGIKSMGYSTENIVFGLGATLYQNNNRDTFGFVFKATHSIINNKDIKMQKNPITNSKKKSHKGLVGVFKKNQRLVCKDELTFDEFNSKSNIIK